MKKEEKQRIADYIQMIAKSMKATFWTCIVVETILIILAVGEIPAAGLIVFLLITFSVITLVNFWVVVSQINKIGKVLIDSE